jgi:flagellar basal-body rod protein FlgG
MAGGLASALNVAVAGLQAQSGVVAANGANIANMTTPGYKRTVATVTAGGVNIPEVFLRRDTSQGAVFPTGNPSDLAISGNGYFQVRLPNGNIGYTRAGDFAVSAAGAMVDQNGNPVVGPVAPVAGGGPLLVAADGTVTQIVGGNPVTIGQIETATLPNAAGLDAAGGNVFGAGAASGQANAGQPGTGGRGEVVQGALESSNVEPVQEIVSMMMAKSAYAASARVIRTVDQMMGELIKKI